MSRILFFDDEVIQSTSIKHLLEEQGYDVVMTSSINEVKELLKQGEISLLVINIDVFEKDDEYEPDLLKKYYEDRNVPVIFIISSLDSEYSPLKSQFDVDDVILKPYREEEVVLRIINHMKRAKNGGYASDELEKMNILFQISNLPHQSMNIEEISGKILEIVHNTFKAESCALYLKDEEEQLALFNFKGPADEDDLKNLIKFTAKAVSEHRNMMFFNDLSREFFWHRVRWKAPQHLLNAVCIPLESGGSAIGSFELYNVNSKQLWEPNSSEVQFLKQVIREVEKVISLSNQFHRVNRDLEFAVDELSILYEISDALSSTINLDELLRLIVRNAIKSFNAQVVSLMMLNKETQILSIKFAEGLTEDIIQNTHVKLGEGIAGRVAKSGQPLLLVDMLGIDSVYMDKSIKSALSVPLKMKDEVIGVLNVSKTSRYRFTETDLKLLFNLASLAAQAIEKAALYQEIKNSLEEIKTSYMSTVKALSKAVEAKDPYTQGHVDRVAKYGLAIALEYDPDLLKDDMFRYALVLHDIGKIEIPDHILTKPGYLTEEEMNIMKKHPEAGAQILSPVKFLKEAAEMVRYHQERYDGKGYPEGLKGEEIPIPARIIAVADTFDAIISNRPYRMARTVEYAKQEIAQNAGKQFDPAVVAAFLAALEKKVIP